MLAVLLGDLRGTLSERRRRALVADLRLVPDLVARALEREEEVIEIARQIKDVHSCLYIGRGINMATAYEGALKLKEISYIHAEGYAAGELKHGPIALIDEDVPVVVVAPRDGLFDKTVSNMEEVAARGGQIILLTNGTARDLKKISAAAKFALPKAHDFINPLLFAVPVQLLSYHTAVAMGTDVDQPRNLAKSVTVE
jgi:glucosamine--fructose-6-phosphate aminotransferase (isomerizing)